MKRRRDNVFARFGRSRKGVAAIEFGMVAIPFLGLLCAIFETAFVFFTHEAFDLAVSASARKILVNTYTTSSSQSAATFKTNVLCPAMPSFITCANVVLNVQAPATSSFSTVGSSLNQTWYATNNDQTILHLGQPGSIVVFQAFYPMPVYLSVLVASGSNGARNLYASTSNSIYANPVAGGTGFVHAIFSTVVFRNEPQ